MPQRGPQHHGDAETESQDQGPGHLGKSPRSYRRLSESEIQEIIVYCNNGVKYRDISAATDRKIGTIKTVAFNLRAAGLIERRYAVWENYSV